MRGYIAKRERMAFEPSEGVWWVLQSVTFFFFDRLFILSQKIQISSSKFEIQSICFTAPVSYVL